VASPRRRLQGREPAERRLQPSVLLGMERRQALADLGVRVRRALQRREPRGQHHLGRGLGGGEPVEAGLRARRHRIDAAGDAVPQGRRLRGLGGADRLQPLGK
jgi:hypothetical protein